MFEVPSPNKNVHKNEAYDLNSIIFMKRRKNGTTKISKNSFKEKHL